MAEIYISYSRRDQDFFSRLHGALRAHSWDTWVDWEGLSPSGEWMEEVYKAIDEASVFVFVISPDSLSSEKSKEELEFAVKQKKPLFHFFFV